MDISLFVPCYVDQVVPDVAMATATVLRRAGCTVHFDERQTCCGQPMANSGCASDAAILARKHLDIFKGQTTVSPSGSCVSMVRHHYSDVGIRMSADDEKTRERTFELSDFLVNVLGIDDLGATFPHRVAMQRSCHGLRELGLGGMSERPSMKKQSPAERLLSKVKGLTLVDHPRIDECCGFGGTFAVDHARLSSTMGGDRCDGFAALNVEYVTGGDSSCLMHLEGCRSRRGDAFKFLHLAEILACS